MKLDAYGPWAVVTGASDGIGRELAEQIAGAGIHVVLVARRTDRLAALSEELRERHHITTRVITADLADPRGVASVIAGTCDLDVGLLVAAAGFGTSGEFLEARLEDELAMIDVNCKAVVALAHGFGRHFAQRGRGGIVLMSSLVAFQGVPRAATYAATKAFIQTLAEALERELAPLGIDVLASAPGPVHSGFAGRARMTMSLAAQPRQIAIGTLRALGHRTTVRPGWLSKLLEWSLALLPRFARVRIMQRVMRGMTP